MARYKGRQRARSRTGRVSKNKIDSRLMFALLLVVLALVVSIVYVLNKYQVWKFDKSAIYRGADDSSNRMIEDDASLYTNKRTMKPGVGAGKKLDTVGKKHVTDHGSAGKKDPEYSDRDREYLEGLINKH